MKLYVYTVEVDNTVKNVISILEPDTVFTSGLVGKSIIGYLLKMEGDAKYDNIVYNADFLELFMATVKSAAVRSEDLKKAALQQMHGLLYIADQRAKSKIETKPHDVIGAFELKDGNIVVDSFQSNAHYQIVSEDGLFVLPEDFERELLNAVTSL